MNSDYLSYVNLLKKVCRDKKHRLISIGMTHNLPFFAVLTGDLNAKQTVCFCAGIHGNERSGTFAMLDFLNEYTPKKGDPRILIFPVANPSGLNEDTYLTIDGLNLNRLFGRKKVENEIHLLYSTVSREPISFFVTFHEDDELDGAYMHGYAGDNVVPKIYTDILKEISGYYRIYPKNTIHNYMANQGLVLNPAADGSFEYIMYRDGVRYSLCVEIPDRMPMSKRIAANIAVMKKVIEFSK